MNFAAVALALADFLKPCGLSDFAAGNHVDSLKLKRLFHMSRLSKAITLVLTGGALCMGGSPAALAGTTMYNTYNNNGAIPCAPCQGPGNGVGGYTDGWIWGLPDPISYRGPDSPGVPGSAVFPWVGTVNLGTTPFGYVGGSSLNWAVQLHAQADSAQISNADALSRYGVSADIDTAKGAWLDNAASPVGWKHDLDIGLFKSDVSTLVNLSVAAVNFTGANFGITVFEGMNSDAAGYGHHGSWNAGADGTPLPSGFSFINTDIVATTDTSAGLANLNSLQFMAQAGQVYTVFVGGWRDGTWWDVNDGYVLTATSVPEPATLWLFGLAPLLPLARPRKQRGKI